MSSPTRDPIAFVEACYDLSGSDTQWLQALADAARPVMRAMSVLAYQLDIDDRGMHVRSAAHSGDVHADVATRILSIGRIFDRRRDGSAGPLERLKSKIFEKVVQAHLAQSVERMLLSELETYGPRWTYTLGVRGVRELFFLINHHIDSHGATYVVGALPDRCDLRPAARTMFLQLGAHVKAGLRLRRRLPEQLRSVQTPQDGAVLDTAGRLVHAEGEARDVDTRALLERRAREIDRARAACNGRDEAALAVWQGLIDGRWSLVERFDADGKRFMLAHKNPEHVVDPRGLTPLEARVGGLAVRGYSDKLIAYHLGVAEGTVSSHLARAMRKLGIESRVELMRTLGGSLPPRRGADSNPPPSAA